MAKVSEDGPREQRVFTPERPAKRLAVAVPQFFVSEPAACCSVRQAPDLDSQLQIEPDNELSTVKDRGPQFAVVVAVYDPAAIVIECRENARLKLRRGRRAPVRAVVERVEFDIW